MILALEAITLPFIVRTLVVLVIIGVCWYLIDKFVPIAEPIKIVIRVVLVLLLVLWLLSAFGLV